MIDNSFLEFVPITSIQHIGMENVVDLTVEEDASFTLSNGFISHNSAIAGFCEARDPQIHGGLPLRGKVLNCHPSKSTPKTVASNEALQQVMRSIGLAVGERADRSKLRYGRIYVTCDADEDGKNISALLTNFFYQMWPELFDPSDPFIHILDTPLLVAIKGKQRQYWYGNNYHEYDPEKMRGWTTRHIKGLGGLEQQDWQYALDNPRSVPIIDDGELNDLLNLLFDENLADDRKAWLAE